MVQETGRRQYHPVRAYHFNRPRQRANELISRLCRHFDAVGASPALYPRMNLEECRHEADYMIPEQSGEFAKIQNSSEPEEAKDEVLGTEARAEEGPAGGEPKAEAQGIEPPAAQNAGGGERDDQALVNAARAGDVLAFGELIKRHWSSCLKRATLMLRNRSDAEDEVQNAFSKALQRIDQFRGDGSFSAWLNRIVENQCLMRIREGQNARFVYLDESTDSNVRLELVSQIEDPEDKLGLDEVLVLLRREVSRMPPLLRNVMLLRDLDQLPMPDVAQRLGLSVPAAKSRLMRARNELRARITKHCGRKGAGTLMQVARYEQSAYTRAH